jgi:glycosyltransferase involved in cell wall biosynthesis
MTEVKEESMQVLVVSSDKYPPFRVDVTILFGRELSRRGLKVDWLLQSEKRSDRDHEVEWGGGRVWVGRTDLGTSRFSRLRKHWLGFRNDLRVKGLAQSGRYGILQVKDKVLAALPTLWAARQSGAAFVYWLSFPHPEASLYVARIGTARYPLLYRVRGWLQFVFLYKYLLPRADHVFVQSEQMKKDLASYGIDAKKMTAVPMGVDLETFAGISTDPARSGSPTIGYLGTLASERNIPFLVRCLALVLDRHPAAKLLLVGDGQRPEDRLEIMQEATRLGIADRVEITGFMPQRQALELMASVTVCVSPFYPTPILNSTSPTKLVEYMALGQAVVANDHPEQRLVLEESRAGLCVPYEETAFADAIARLISDRVMAAEMGLRGRNYVLNHREYGRIAEMVLEKYTDILRSRQSRIAKKFHGNAK